MTSKIKHILCVGGGLLGLPVAKHFADNHQVSVIKRSKNQIPSSINFIYADLTHLDEVKQALPKQVDIVLVCLTPSEFSEAGYKQIFIEGLGNLLKAFNDNNLSPERLLFVSSTSVYHQNDSQWVDENSDTKPAAFSGQILLNAEKMLSDCEFPTTTVRFSGIYGGNRVRLLEQARMGKLPQQAYEVFTNRIHERDCIGFLQHIISQCIEGKPLPSLYLASDCAPVSTNTLSDWFRQHIKCQPADENATPTKRRAGSKKCNNQRMLESGYQFKYPSWREGYSEMIQRLYPDQAL